jgi:pilus assembly protein CpaE
VSSPSRSTAQIRLLLVEDVAQVSQFIRGLLDAQSQIKLLDVISDGTVVVDQVSEMHPDIVVIDGLLRGQMDGLQVARALREAGHEVPIICLTVPHKPVAVGEGMGLTRILSMPFSGFDFVNLVKELDETRRRVAPTEMSRVVAVFGAKGGVGATTLAYNVGASIAATGRQSVALLDGSLQFADLRALLQIDDGVPAITDLPTAKVSQHDLSEVAWRDRSGMDIFFAPPRPEMAEMISAQDVAKLIALLRRVYNVVVVDTASSLNDVNLALLDAADQILVVLAYEAATLRQSLIMISTFVRIGYPADKLRFLLNRSDSVGGLTPSEIEAQLGRPPEFRVVSDGPLVLAANNQGRAFVSAWPDAQVSRDVAAVARAVSAPDAAAVVGR